jgi:hypothetical protein
VIIDPSNLDWKGDEDECTLPITCTIDTQDNGNPYDDSLVTSPYQTLMDQHDKIEGVYFEVPGTLSNTDCTIPKRDLMRFETVVLTMIRGHKLIGLRSVRHQFQNKATT